MRNYIFDLDGTLINSSEEVMKCFSMTFEKSEYPLDKSRLTPEIIGPPLDEIIQNLAPEINDKNKIDELVKNFSYFYDNEQNDISKIYDGVYEVLETLQKDNCRLFMATFKPTAPTMRIVSQFNLNYFEEIYTIDKFGEFITKTDMINIILDKYGLDKNETCMVGDAVSDVKSAKSAGVLAIGALWGYGKDKQPLIENSDITLKNIKELLK